jgi:tetratricopeptide (TPR) repeat protein
MHMHTHARTRTRAHTLKRANARARRCHRCLPHEKLAFVQALQAQGEVVVYVGDGSNDAAALARAHVGVSLGVNDLASDGANVIFLRNSLGCLVELLALARRTDRTARLGVNVGMGCSVAQMVLAASGVFPPFVNACLQECVDLGSIVNSLTILQRPSRAHARIGWSGTSPVPKPATDASPALSPIGPAAPPLQATARPLPGPTAITTSPSPAPAATLSEATTAVADARPCLFAAADALFSARRYDECLAALHALAAAAHDEPALLWRQARASRFVATQRSDAHEKHRVLLQGLDFARRCTSSAPECAAGHKWLAVCFSKSLDFGAPTEKLKNAQAIRAAILRSIALDDTDAYAHHVIGEYCFAIAEKFSNWYTRKLASAIVSDVPSATFDEALTHFLRAEAASPGFWDQNSLRIAQCYAKLGDKAKSRDWAVRCLQRAEPKIMVEWEVTELTRAEAEKLI